MDDFGLVILIILNTLGSRLLQKQMKLQYEPLTACVSGIGPFEIPFKYVVIFFLLLVFSNV